MTVRRQFSFAVALIALLIGAGCGDRDRTPIPAETDEPYYVQGKQLVKQGRNPEALTAFLKVIDRRGERGAAESHLEAGFIYLNHTKDPVEAYHHFRKYLDLQPNSKEAVRVRGMVEAAKREFARSLPARPLEDQSVRLQAEEALAKVQRENEELRAQIATLRGGGAMPVSRAAPMINLPEDPQTRPTPPVAAVVDSSKTPAPPTRPPLATSGTAAQTPATTAPKQTKPAVNSRPSTPSVVMHTVAPKETLFQISRRYNVRVDEIVSANAIKNPNNVPVGTVLKIPVKQ
jgi:LysM repeat protein